MKKTIAIIFILFLFTISLTGCMGSKPAFDDSKYGFVSYVTYEYELNKASYYDKETEISTMADDIKYAITKDNILYSYNINEDSDENYSLVAKKALPKGEHVDKIIIIGDTVMVTTENGKVYEESDEDQFNLIEDSAQVKVANVENDDNTEDNNELLIKGENASILTSDGTLYMTGDNSLGQLGNGEVDDQATERSLVLENVKSFDFKPNDSYYIGAALTNDKELYVWGILPQTSSEEEFTTDWSGEEYTDSAIVVHPHPKQSETTTAARKIADDVESFQLDTDGVTVTMADGENLTLNDEEANIETETEDENEYWNDQEITNRWEPTFDSVMVSLNGSYYGDDLDHITGEIYNSTNESWQYVEIEFALYDGDGNYMQNITAATTENVAPGQSVSFETEEGYLVGSGIKRYEVINIRPM